MENIEKLKRFIVDNDLQFTEGRRNSDCTIISGFALHLGETDITHIDVAIEATLVEPADYYDELERVFDFAKFKNYGAWWSSEDAKKQYIF
jgi:hypothetical protein